MNVGDSRGSVADLAVLDDIHPCRKNTWMKYWYKACIRVQNRVVTGKPVAQIPCLLIETRDLHEWTLANLTKVSKW